MTEMAPARPRRGVPAVLTRTLATALGPLWRTTFRDPVREGRFRLSGLGAVERQAGRVGLVTLVVLLGSTLLAARWRRGALLPVAGVQELVPGAVVGLTLVGFAVAWVVILWGGLRATAPVRVLVGVGYGLLNADFAVDLANGFGSSAWILQHYRTLQQLGYLGPVAALLLAGLTTRWRAVDRWVVRAGRAVCLLGPVFLFLGLLWAHAVQLRAGRTALAPTTVGGALLEIGLVLLPLVYVSAVAVVDFALDVSSSLAEPAASLRRGWLLGGVLVLAAAKLWFEVGARTDYWGTALAHQAQAVVRTAVCVVLLGVLAFVVTRFRHSEDSLAAKEDLTLGSSLVLAAPYVGQILVLMLGIVVYAHLGTTRGLGWSDHFPASWLSTWGMLIASAVAVVAGIVLMRRSRGGMGDELGSGLVLLGAWGTVAGAISNSGLALGFSYPTVDVTVTIGVLLVVLLRWRRADPALLLTAATVLVFSWLVTSQGDYISFLGGLVGLSAVVVVVFGIVWTLLSASSFVATSSRWLPQPSRPLLFLGYVLLSVAILNWNEAAHTTTSGADALTAYYLLGIPLAAFLLGRRVVTRPEPAAGVGAAAGKAQ